MSRCVHVHAIVTLAACACNCNTRAACTASIVWTAPCKPPPSSPPLPLPATPPRDTPARFKAASYNASYAGAMFPWESAASGEETCPVQAGTSGDCFRAAPKQLIFVPEELRQFGSVRVVCPAFLVPCRSPPAHAPPPRCRHGLEGDPHQVLGLWFLVFVFCFLFFVSCLWLCNHPKRRASAATLCLQSSSCGRPQAAHPG